MWLKEPNVFVCCGFDLRKCTTTLVVNQGSVQCHRNIQRRQGAMFCWRFRFQIKLRIQVSMYACIYLAAEYAQSEHWCHDRSVHRFDLLSINASTLVHTRGAGTTVWCTQNAWEHTCRTKVLFIQTTRKMRPSAHCTRCLEMHQDKGDVVRAWIRGNLSSLLQEIHKPKHTQTHPNAHTHTHTQTHTQALHTHTHTLR